MHENKTTIYSESKTKAKFTLEYSVLYPETNSDSDSLKSKGARCVSAKIQINQIGKSLKNNTLLIFILERIE